MPIYEYGCECGRGFDLLQEPGEAAAGALCPFCGSCTPKRLMPTSIGIVTKTGFDRNTDDCKDLDKCHKMRMYNKRCIERDWEEKVEKGGWKYDPGTAPRQYQPKQYTGEK